MTFEAQQKSVQDNGSYEGAKIYCLQKLEPEQWRFCDTKTRIKALLGVLDTVSQNLNSMKSGKR